MDIRNPVTEEISDLINKVSGAFGYREGEPGVGQDFPQLYQACNSKRLWIAKEGNTIAAHAGFYPSLMKVEGLPLPVSGIGGVFTDEAHQGKGLATSLINRCVEEARKEGAALAFLWSDKHEFYKKQGFHLVGRQWTLSFDPSMAPKLRALGEKAEIPARALRISEEVNGELLRQSHALLEFFPIGISRSPEEHAMYLDSGSCRVVSAWAGQQLAAYFVIGKGRDLQGYVHEWAGAEGACHHLMAQCLEDFAHPLKILSPQYMLDEVPWVYAMEEAGVPMTAEYLALVKLLDFPRIQKLMQDYLTRLGIKPDEFKMERESEDYLVSWRGRTAMKFDEGGLLQLLFGPGLPEQEELRAFLPMRLWYWGMDSV